VARNGCGSLCLKFLLNNTISGDLRDRALYSIEGKV
jgi:hypothetical protein